MIPFEIIEEKLKSLILGTDPLYLHTINVRERGDFKTFEIVLNATGHDVSWISRIDEHLCLVRAENGGTKIKQFLHYNFKTGTYYLCMSMPRDYTTCVSLNDIYREVMDAYETIISCVYGISMPVIYNNYHLVCAILSAKFGMYTLGANLDDYLKGSGFRKEIERMVEEDVIALDWENLLNILQTKGL